MRKVEADISNLGLKITDSVTLQLLDILGNPASFVEDGKLINFNETTIIDDEILSFELWENDKSKSTTYYQLTINSINYKFTVPSGSGTHDLLSLFTMGCNDGVSYIKDSVLYFEEDFIKKIKHFFNSKEPNFSKTQEKAFEQFVIFANTIHGTNRTNDFAEALNKYLGDYVE